MLTLTNKLLIVELTNQPYCILQYLNEFNNWHYVRLSAGQLIFPDDPDDKSDLSSGFFQMIPIHGCLASCWHAVQELTGSILPQITHNLDTASTVIISTRSRTAE
jgi:hypothetical protein